MVILTVLILPIPRPSNIFPFLSVTFSFLYQCFTVLESVNLSRPLSGLFLGVVLLFWGTFFFLDMMLKVIFFFTFSFFYFIVLVKKCNRCMYINLVSCYFAEFISSNSFCVESFRFSYRIACYLHIMTVLPLPFQYGHFFLSFFLLLLSDYCG